MAPHRRYTVRWGAFVFLRVNLGDDDDQTARDPVYTGMFSF